MTKRLEKKVALVTGASQGIGRAVAIAYAREGARVALVGRRAEELQKVTQQIKREGGEALPLVGDVSEEEDAVQSVKATEESFRKIDILVTCAGILTPRSPIAKVTVEDWDRTMAVNVRGSFLFCREVLKGMTPRRSGSIILLSSGAGKRPAPEWGPYAVSKFGIEGLMQALAEEVRQEGIRVNAVNPGGTRTRMRAMAYPEEDPVTIPAPEEITGLFIYLASDLSRSVTGQSIELREWFGSHPEWK